MAQQNKGRNPSRSVGNMRMSNEFVNGRQTLPPVSSVRTEPSFGNGLLVSSMAVPPQKQPTSSARKPPTSELKAKSGNSPEYGARKEELERLLREKERIIKEKDKELRERSGIIKSKEQDITSLNQEKETAEDRIAKLEKECQQLKQTIKSKESDIETLQSRLQAKDNETDYKSLYEKEKADHATTTDRLSMCEAQLKEKDKKLNEIELKHKNEMDSLKKKMEDDLAAAVSKYEDDLRDRDQKIVKLKKQMAEAFTGNSMERQQQIDELTKELTKVQGECDALRIRSKQGGHKNGAACENCKNLKAHLEKKDQTIKEKNRTLEELNLVCSRYEVQLKQQEELLKQWQDVKDEVKEFLDKDDIR